MTADEPRPGIVDAAFWLWVIAAALLVLFGMLSATSGDAVFYRGAGVIFALTGLGLGYLAGQSRRGDRRFHRAAVALAMVLVFVLALYALLSIGWVWLVIMFVLMIGTFLAMRPVTLAWFDAVDKGGIDG